VLVEDAVVGEELLPVHRPNLTVGAHGACVREVAVEPGCPDERDEALGRARDLVEYRPRGTYEARPQKQVLGRVAGHRELREDDEVGLGGTRLGEEGEDLVAVSLEVPDDGVQLGEREPQGFRLTVTNRV
jgi:hypothetical protein